MSVSYASVALPSLNTGKSALSPPHCDCKTSECSVSLTGTPICGEAGVGATPTVSGHSSGGLVSTTLASISASNSTSMGGPAARAKKSVSCIHVFEV